MEYLEIGQIVNTHGVKGEVKINPFTDNVEQFNDLNEIDVKLKGNIKNYKILSVKFVKNQVVLKLEGINSIEEANLLRQAIIVVPKNYDNLEPGQFYIVDLLGLDVINENGETIGVVEDIFNTGANDVYVIKRQNAKNLLLPGTDECILDVSLENRQIKVHIPKGLDDEI